MNKMTVAAALAALAVGAAAGWLAAGARGKNKCENVEVCKYGNVETANGGRAGRSATAADRESKVSEAELAALRDKEASLKKELKEVLAAKRGKPEVDMRGKDGDSPIGVSLFSAGFVYSDRRGRWSPLAKTKGSLR